MDSLLKHITDSGASDLHLTVASRPIMRLSGRLLPIPETEIMLPPMLKSIVYLLLDEDHQATMEKNGEVDFSFSVSGVGRFRANAYLQRGSHTLAIRSLPVTIPSLESLKLPDILSSFLTKSKGLVLVTGPTGSGKSTTLASMINAINATRNCHIITIEDPIEYLHKHNMSIIEQREIGSDSKTFSAALRAALREDPDVILVGEMRDPETISIALSAAETGHLVFSTLHTVGAAKTVDRIVDSFSAEQQNQVRGQLATVLEGVVSQVLIPKKEGKGRVVACEIMLCNSAVRNLIREGKQFQINSIIQTNSTTGMQLLDARLAELCAQNIISKEEALMRTNDQQVFSQLLLSYRSRMQ